MDFKDKDSDDITKFFEATERTCSTCSRRERIPFEQPIPESQYYEYIEKNRRCDICGNSRTFKPEYYSPSKEEKSNDKDDDIENGPDGNGKLTKAEIALDEVAPHCKKLFVDQYRIAHATIAVNEHMEIHPIDSSRFRKWARRIIYNETGIVIDTQTLTDAMAVLSAEAEFDSGKAIPLSLRVADDEVAYGNGINTSTSTNTNTKSKWYYDLTNEKWEIIEIT